MRVIFVRLIFVRAYIEDPIKVFKFLVPPIIVIGETHINHKASY